MNRRSLLKAIGLAPLAGMFAREAVAEPIPPEACEAARVLNTPMPTADAEALERAVERMDDDVPQAVSLDGWRAKHGGESTGEPMGPLDRHRATYNDGLEHDVAFSITCTHEWERSLFDPDPRTPWTCTKCDKRRTDASVHAELMAAPLHNVRITGITGRKT